MLDYQFMSFYYSPDLIFKWNPGVPIMYITQHKYSIERLPEATIGGGRLNPC